MGDSEDSLGAWIDLTGRLLSQPLVELPFSILIQELTKTLGATAGAWVQQDLPSPPVVELHPTMAMPATGTIDLMQSHLGEHPLIKWFTVSHDPAAETLSRVPHSLCDGNQATWRAMTAPLGLEEQISIPLAFSGSAYRAFVLMKTEHDFSEEDLALARRIQPLLIGLDRQARTLARWVPRASNAEQDMQSVSPRQRRDHNE